MDPEGYDRWYETPRGRWIGEREAAVLLESVQPRPGESLLDVGCGTGFFTRVLASAMTGPVTGVDVNPDVVKYARSKTPSGISWEVGDAAALPYEDASFDLVVSITALCFIDKEREAVCEMLRVARRRVAIGLLNRRSLLSLQKRGRGAYRGARWHTVREAVDLFRGLPGERVGVRTAIHLPGGGFFARAVESACPVGMRSGGFILVVADAKRD